MKTSAAERRLAILLDDPLLSTWADAAAARYGVSALRALHMMAVALDNDLVPRVKATRGYDLSAGSHSSSGRIAGTESAPGMCVAKP